MLRIAAVQHDIVWEDRDANLAALAPLVAKAAGEGARPVLLTETFAVGFSMATDRTAEPRAARPPRLVDQAAHHGIWVVAPCPSGPRAPTAPATPSSSPARMARCTGTTSGTRSASARRTSTSKPVTRP